MTPSNADLHSDTKLSIDQACARLDLDAILRAQETDDPEERLKWIDISKSIRERCKTVVEEANARFQGQNAMAEVKHQRSRFVATTLTPVLSVLITGLALVFQANQFRITSENQTKQFKAGSELQAAQSEDEKWRESMKAVSLSDPKASFVGTLAMQAFFDSPRYGGESKSIASALLPNVNNVTGFDEVFDDLIRRIATNNQYEITGLSSMLLMSAREEHHLTGAALPDSSPLPGFLIHDVESIDPNPDYGSGGQQMRDKVHAWELDSVSQGLKRLWVERKFNPDKYLVGIVLENASFNGLDFSGANLQRSVLLDAHFEGGNFSGADLTNVTLRNVSLDGADLSAIAKFNGSTWDDIGWWRAKCVSPELYENLIHRYPIPSAADPVKHSKSIMAAGCKKS